MISLSYDKVKIYLTLYGFSQYRSYTDFDFKLDGYWLRLLTKGPSIKDVRNKIAKN